MAEVKACIGKNIKISKGSITIKDENNKTCGVVRNICKFKDLQPNKIPNYYRKVREAGLWGCNIDGLIDCAVIVDNELYYLHNLKPLETYREYFADDPYGYFEYDKKCYEKRLEIVENMEHIATVIPCYVG